MPSGSGISNKLAAFEKNISANNEAGVTSSMYLSTILTKQSTKRDSLVLKKPSDTSNGEGRERRKSLLGANEASDGHRTSMSTPKSESPMEKTDSSRTASTGDDDDVSLGTDDLELGRAEEEERSSRRTRLGESFNGRRSPSASRARARFKPNKSTGNLNASAPTLKYSAERVSPEMIRAALTPSKWNSSSSPRPQLPLSSGDTMPSPPKRSSSDDSRPSGKALVDRSPEFVRPSLQRRERSLSPGKVTLSRSTSEPFDERSPSRRRRTPTPRMRRRGRSSSRGRKESPSGRDKSPASRHGSFTAEDAESTPTSAGSNRSRKMRSRSPSPSPAMLKKKLGADLLLETPLNESMSSLGGSVRLAPSARDSDVSRSRRRSPSNERQKSNEEGEGSRVRVKIRIRPNDPNRKSAGSRWRRVRKPSNAGKDGTSDVTDETGSADEDSNDGDQDRGAF